jgi:hypothetical protein
MDVDPPTNESGYSIQTEAQDLEEIQVNASNETPTQQLEDPSKLNSIRLSPARSPERGQRVKSPPKSPSREKPAPSPARQGRSSPTKSSPPTDSGLFDTQSMQRSPTKQLDNPSEDVFEFLQFPEKSKSPPRVEEVTTRSSKVLLHENNNSDVFDQQAHRFENQLVQLRKELSTMTKKYEEKALITSKTSTDD